MATVVEAPAPVPSAVWQGCQGRPWLTLYGLRLRPKSAPSANQVCLLFKNPAERLDALPVRPLAQQTLSLR